MQIPADQFTANHVWWQFSSEVPSQSQNRYKG